MPEFAGNKVGANLFRLLQAAQERFLAVEYTGDRNLGTKPKPRDLTIYANMPEIAVYATLVDPAHQAMLPKAFAELWSVDLHRNRDLGWGRAPESGFISEFYLHDQLLIMLAGVLKELLWADPEVHNKSVHRFRRINERMLYNYGMKRSEFERTKSITMTPLSTPAPCHGRIFGSMSGGDCHANATFAVVVPRVGRFTACNRDVYSVFRPLDNWGKEPGHTWKDLVAHTGDQ